MPTVKPDRNTIAKIINYCNSKLINDHHFDSDHIHHTQWFIDCFSFISDDQLKIQLGEAFYLARFLYTLMEAMSLPMAKNKGFIKFQIIQYASICEALLNYVIEKHFLSDFATAKANTTYTPINQALSTVTKITYEDIPIFLGHL